MHLLGVWVLVATPSSPVSHILLGIEHQTLVVCVRSPLWRRGTSFVFVLILILAIDRCSQVVVIELRQLVATISLLTVYPR